MSATWSSTDEFASHIASALPDRTVTVDGPHVHIHRQQREDRADLLQLAQDINAGRTRRSHADELVPLIAAHCPHAHEVFAALTEAVEADESAEVERLLSMLTRAAA